MVTPRGLKSIGWLVLLGVCLALFLALTFKVNSVKSQVRLAERQIVALEQDKLLYETEFQTLANQRQLADWNQIEFGYGAPRADQYVENERQLASLGLPQAADAPDPLRLARSDDGESAGAGVGFPAMVSPISGKPVSQDTSPPSNAPDSDRKPARSLSERLSGGADLSGYAAGSAR